MGLNKKTRENQMTYLPRGYNSKGDAWEDGDRGWRSSVQLRSSLVVELWNENESNLIRLD